MRANMKGLNCRSGIYIRFLISVVILIFAHCSYADPAKNSTRVYSIKIVGCPTKLKLKLPGYFVRPVTPSEIQDRDNMIRGLHSNPGRKARYSEIFLTDWSNKETYPIIMVYSLGSLIKRQGKINAGEWYKLKTNFLKMTASQKKEALKTGIERLVESTGIAFDDLNSKISSITTTEDNSIVMLGVSRAIVLGKTVNTYNAAKMIYSNSCISAVTVAVDATPADSIVLLANIVSDIDIK